jgi:L-fuconolactonase
MPNRIDAHQHFWKFDAVRDSWINESMYKLQNDFLPENLLPLLQQNYFEGCVAVQADQSEMETRFLLDLAAQHPFIKGVVGWIDLCDKNIAERLDFFSLEKKLKGFRHIAEGEADDFLLRDDFNRGIEALKPFNYTYDILVRPHQLKAAITLVNHFPDQPFVLDHIAKPDIKSGNIESWKKDIQQLAKAENVMCKVSGMVTEADWHNWKPADFKHCLDVVFESFTPKRLMFGSDWPVCNVAAHYHEVVKTVEDYTAQLSAAEQEMIWCSNARTFYNL